MNQAEILYNAMLAVPADALPRLVYADHLEERGYPLEAGIVRRLFGGTRWVCMAVQKGLSWDRKYALGVVIGDRLVEVQAEVWRPRREGGSWTWYSRAGTGRAGRAVSRHEAQCEAMRAVIRSKVCAGGYRVYSPTPATV